MASVHDYSDKEERKREGADERVGCCLATYANKFHMQPVLIPAAASFCFCSLEKKLVINAKHTAMQYLSVYLVSYVINWCTFGDMMVCIKKMNMEVFCMSVADFHSIHFLPVTGKVLISLFGGGRSCFRRYGLIFYRIGWNKFGQGSSPTSQIPYPPPPLPLSSLNSSNVVQFLDFPT